WWGSLMTSPCRRYPAVRGKNHRSPRSIKEYDGHPEIILKDPRQLRGEAARIPPLPKKFDVENKGRYSAGKLSHPKPGRRKTAKPDTKPIDTGEAEELTPENWEVGCNP